MQRLYDLKAKFNDLAINTTSVPSSASETSASTNQNVRPKYPIRKPTMKLFPETQNINPLPTIKIVTKHSHGFNSERATGLNKLQQLQFVETLKEMVVEEAPLVHNQFAKYTAYRVITVRKTGEILESPITFTSDTFYIAKLFGVTSSDEWTLLEQSEEVEYLTDAVEDLWEKVMTKVGVKTAGVKVGEVLETEDLSEAEKSEKRKSVGW